MADKVASHPQNVTCRADNMQPSVQHAPMRIACPHCQAIYEVATAEPDVSFLCSRCHNEFRMGEGMVGSSGQDRQAPSVPDGQMGLFEKARPEKPQGGIRYQPADSHAQPPLFLERLASTDTLSPVSPPGGEQKKHADVPQDRQRPTAKKPQRLPEPVAAAAPPPAKETDTLTPERRAPRLLTWMSGVMLIVAIAGFAYNHQSWAENTWVRSTLLNLHLPITVHASDWRIPPDSVHAEWLKRDDGSAVLVIEGRVDNLLHTQLATPWIEVTVYDAIHSDKTVKRRTYPITLPPAIDAIRHAPWVPPPQDNVPVAAAGSRGFILVITDLPRHAGEFTLNVIPPLFR
jgi:hypothetical protein